jgi:hypothetical protein
VLYLFMAVSLHEFGGGLVDGGVEVRRAPLAGLDAEGVLGGAIENRAAPVELPVRAPAGRFEDGLGDGDGGGNAGLAFAIERGRRDGFQEINLLLVQMGDGSS